MIINKAGSLSLSLSLSLSSFKQSEEGFFKSGSFYFFIYLFYLVSVENAGGETHGFSVFPSFWKENGGARNRVILLPVFVGGKS